MYLRSAKRTLDICVFTISDDYIAEVIRQKHQSGVRVRIITDDDTRSNQGSDIIELQRLGIPVKTDDSPSHMHHKFAILDGKVLINGSFNWTVQASTACYEQWWSANFQEPHICRHQELRYQVFRQAAIPLPGSVSHQTHVRCEQSVYE